MRDTQIAALRGRAVWDSRGRPTVEAEVRLSGGTTGRAIAPAGASCGSQEALELRDGGHILGGLGVGKAVANVNGEIAAALIGRDARNQRDIDRALVALDGSDQLGRIGGNATIAVSMAVLQAAAAASGLPLYQYLSNERVTRLPRPEIQIFGGGAHAGRRVDVQDFLVVCPAAETFDEALVMTAEVYLAAGGLMDEAGQRFGVADEGGFWPAFDSNRAALDTLTCAIAKAGYRPGFDVAIALDIAASEFYRDGVYHLACDDKRLSPEQMIDMVADWIACYPIVSVEDPLAEDDSEGFAAFSAAVPDYVQVVGDDFLVTDADRIAAAAKAGAANTALIKPNQAGTVTAARDALAAAHTAGWDSIVSARSGESEDVTIMHLAAGWGASQLKVGSITRAERTAKWNEGLRIQDALTYNLGRVPALSSPRWLTRPEPLRATG
ncbi:MAG: phosphopyruvate hydratase [Alphaproteobacteria bacterium]|nr:phosphopyruvate hydratase [Alphaproteobacteria bacterium]